MHTTLVKRMLGIDRVNEHKDVDRRSEPRNHILNNSSHLFILPGFGFYPLMDKRIIETFYITTTTNSNVTQNDCSAN